MISTIIPIQNSWENVSAAVRLARRDPCVGEIIVLDDGSIDQMNELDDSAPVKRIPSILPGKGASMEDGLRAAQNEVVLYLDGSLDGLSSDLIQRLPEPIAERWAAFAKPACPAHAAPIAELTTQLALHSFFPELDSYSQPFSGMVAARRGLLETFSFEGDYGVHIGLLIDAAMSGEALAGNARRTFRFHLAYALLDAAAGGILLNAPLVALKAFHAANWHLPLRELYSGIGMIATLYLGSWMARRPKMPFVFLPGLLAAISSLAMAAATGSAFWFLTLFGIGAMFEITTRPAVTAILRVNYPVQQRGHATGEVRKWSSLAFVTLSLVSPVAGEGRWSLALRSRGGRGLAL